MLTTFLLDLLWSSTRSGNAVNPMAAGIPPYNMTETMLQHVGISVLLSDLVWREETKTNELQEVFADFNDRVLVRYERGSCYVAFRGAWSGNPTDLLQSVPMPFAQDVCGSEGCCTVERGMYRAYYSRYVDRFEAAVQRCTERCDDGPCELVITGHSQGASIAPVAAIALAEYNPTLLTFGQHMTQVGHCDVLENMDTYLRFNSMCPMGTRPSYDNLPVWGNLISGRHSGTHILLGAGGAATLGYNNDMALLPFREACHNIYDPYMTSIDKLEPGLMDGFSVGSLCSRDIECQSKKCVQKRCSAGVHQGD